MDPTGIITGVIDLFSVAHQIQGLVEKYKNAPKAVRDIIDECEWTKTLCLSLRNQISQTDALKNPGKHSPERALRQSFDTCMHGIQKTLIELKEEAGKLQSISNSRMGKWDKAKFLWKEEFFAEAAQSVRSQRDMVALVLSTLTWYSSSKLEKGMERVLELLENGHIKASKPTPQLDQLQPPQELKKSRLDNQINTTGKGFAEDLLAAVRGGRLVDVEPILAQGASPDIALGGSGDRAVHIAARAGFLPILDRLLAYGADVNVENTARNTPLHQALTWGQIPTSLTLLSNGASWTIKNANGTTALHVAGQTPLFKACYPADKDGKMVNVDCKIIRILVERGADPIIGAWGNGNTPIHELALSGHVKELEILAKAVKTVELPLAGNCQGTTPLHLAVKNNHPGAVDVLIKFKANVNARQTSKGGTVSTALWLAAWNKNLDIATKLLEAGADPNVRGNDGTILHLAVKEHWLELVCLLIQHKADIDAKSSSNNSPLHTAVWAKDLPIARLLLEKGAGLMVKGSSNETPIMAAARIGSLPMIRLMLKHGAQWSYMTPQGTNAFTWACSGGHVACASFFLGCGHDLQQKADGDFTALHYAARTGKMECVKWLLELGIDKQATSTKVRVPFMVKGTAAEVARAHGAVDVADFIERYRGE
ncbi:hypothetical protein CORC01_05158 [Colletotrichum orchidophilum]|uniref:Uncharacterized protein n=1 Tax=Colletotrichum orchidophilum TaxID=1209926 RepID=A0A1G4BDW2_9PEZI|nr:uncharacterized protein CORC01_05158 [Colletotrichum orchidophilum]OHE99580.1 hypothetical protein CORC01_05158 [Colletotrichum orchidophilum]